MSFILDALKKSERERQKKSSPKISSVLLEQEKFTRPKWYRLTVFSLLIVIGILLIGLIFPSTLKMINDKQPNNSKLTQEIKVTPFVETKIQDIAQEEIIPKISDNDAFEIFDINIANSKYNLFLPELHIDIHVYSEIPSERFVFINMKKYIEGDLLIAGLILETITIEGAILSSNNIHFLLPKN